MPRAKTRSASSSPVNNGEIKRKRFKWDNDAVGGGKSSIDIILSWLTEDGNYDRWKGSDVHKGLTKESLCAEVVCLLQQYGIYTRKPADVRTKISELEKSFKTAKEWLDINGKEIRASQSNAEQIIRAQVMIKCRYFDILYPVFSDVPRAKFPLKSLPPLPQFDPSPPSESESASSSLQRFSSRSESSPSPPPRKVRPVRKTRNSLSSPFVDDDDSLEKIFDSENEKTRDVVKARKPTVDEGDDDDDDDGSDEVEIVETPPAKKPKPILKKTPPPPPPIVEISTSKANVRTKIDTTMLAKSTTPKKNNVSKSVTPIPVKPPPAIKKTPDMNKISKINTPDSLQRTPINVTQALVRDLASEGLPKTPSPHVFINNTPRNKNKDSVTFQLPKKPNNSNNQAKFPEESEHDMGDDEEGGLRVRKLKAEVRKLEIEAMVAEVIAKEKLKKLGYSFEEIQELLPNDE